MLSFSECLFCTCVLFIYTISISIICVSQKEPSHIASNQQVKKRHCGKCIFYISELFIQCDKDSCCEHITSGVNIYLYWCVSLLAPECVVCLCMCLFVYVWYQIRVPAKTHMCQTSVNLTPCCMKYRSRSFWY